MGAGVIRASYAGNLMSVELVVLRNIAGAFALIGVLITMLIVLQREWVAQDLRMRIMRPVSIRWSPFARGWLERMQFPQLGSAFRVRFVDPLGNVHEGLCVIRLWKQVVWLEDWIIGCEGEGD